MQMTFFVLMPSVLLSGFMIPFSGMPRVAQWLAEVLLLTHFLRSIRGVMCVARDYWSCSRTYWRCWCLRP